MREGAARSVAETHLSIVVFLGEHAYKFRKHVRFPFADLSTAGARERDCYREVELNRRLAPDVYLGVAQLRLAGDDVAAGGPVEHAVVMRRLPEECRLATIVAAGATTSAAGDAIDAVAERLAAFHATAERSPSITEDASPTAVAAALDDNVTEMAPLIDRHGDPGVFARVVELARRFVAGRSPLFALRCRNGDICDGHGDLQADDVYCCPDGVRILDCLQIDDRLRHVDIASDVAFLAMDVEVRGEPAAAELFVERYEAHAGQELPPALLDYYIATRALVRAKVGCIRHDQGGDTATGVARYLELARRHLERSRVRLVVVGGLPGSGKSTLAHMIAERIGARVLRTDELRRVLPSPPGPGERYRPDAVRAVYESMFAAARSGLEMGTSVVVDATFAAEERRAHAVEVARACHAEVALVHCVVDDDVAERRLAARSRHGTSLSEADVEVRRSMASGEAPWPAGCDVDTGESPEVSLERALEVLERRS